jgi:hypothetical protein
MVMVIMTKRKEREIIERRDSTKNGNQMIIVKMMMKVTVAKTIR